ncbi:DUF4185 domain-containing protein [Microbacterium sp. I2]|uniref:DUF4185 domain-containing protein n=1 Tax=Microbacterium sp. I2 TaxID=3391826 RepID=UPI003ED9C567
MSTARSRVRVAAVVASASLAVAITACSGGPPVVPDVDADQDKPFVLADVSNLTEIAQLTGPGAMNDTEAAAVAGTDLGSMTNLGDRTYFFFGDTFGQRDPESIGGQGGIWRSNVSAWTTDEDPADGITFGGWAPVDDLGWAEALVEGDHDPNDGEGEVTKIPTHGFAIGDTLYISYMSVSYWGEPGAWDANYAGLAKSTDQGETWTALDGPRWPGDSNFVQVAPMIVSDGGDEYVYFWTIPSGRFGGVALMRVPAAEESVEDLSAYSYFAGTGADGAPIWSTAMADAELVVDGTIGELSVMFSEHLDRWLMTYSDDGNAYIREGITPWGPWNEPILLVSSMDYPGLYSPYLNPKYVSDDGRTIFFTLSLWEPYNVFWFSVELDRSE